VIACDLTPIAIAIAVPFGIIAGSLAVYLGLKAGRR
jgi:hypothetical protein